MTMPVWLQPSIEHFVKNYLFYVWVFSMFVICAGIARWLVSLEVVQGTSFDEAWLYERTDSDYRLVTRSGSNHIIPAANVKEIRGL
jgi:hypothetical protein